MAKKYIDVERLKAEIERLYDGEAPKHDQQCDFDDGYFTGIGAISKFIDFLQQDETQVDRMLCSQVWWEEQGWIMIPPDATIEGIDSLLRQVRKKLQQEQSEVDLKNEIITQWSKCNPTDEGMGSEYAIIAVEQFAAIARHFWNKGYNARKEDDK